MKPPPQLEEFAEYSRGVSFASPEAKKARWRSALAAKTGRETAEQLIRLFGRENVYVELQRHWIAKRKRATRRCWSLRSRLRLPLVATNGVCHATPPQREMLDVFTCLHHKTTLAEAGRLLARNSERHVKTRARNERAVRRSSRSHRQHAGDLRAAAIHARRPGL